MDSKQGVISDIIIYLNENSDKIEPAYKTFVNSCITFFEQNGYVGTNHLKKIKGIYYQIFSTNNLDKIVDKIDTESKYYSFVTSCYGFYLRNEYLGEKQAIALFKIHKYLFKE